MAKTKRTGRTDKGIEGGIKGASLGRHPAKPVGQVALAFRPAKELRYVRDALFRDVSALAVAGRTLFCACDETASVERLVLDEAGGRFTSHENFSLGDTFDLPDGADGEMDIEGIAVDGDYLWITGSHSLKRCKTETGDDDLSALEEIKWDSNRGFLGRLPLYEAAPGVYEPMGRIETLDAEEARRGACLKPDKQGHTILRDLLIEDRLLKPFMGVPSKENGFDVEGMAVLGERVFLGLRGPVIGSQALMVEVRLEATKKGWLKMRSLGDGSPYRLHALDLGGLGVRDMVLWGGRLLVLAGATMNFEGPQAVFVLDELPEEGGPIGADRLKRAIELPVTPGYDHAEGITPVEVGGATRLMVVYDSPAPERVNERENTVTTDLFEMP